jgi:phage tail-like protein
MARPSTKDPLLKFRWAVRIDGFGKAGFTQVSAPGFTVNTKTYREGGAHLFPKQIVDTIDYKPVVLSRGATSNTDFLTWTKSLFFIIGAGQDTTEDSGARENFRRDVRIDHIDRQGDIVKTYTLRNAFPIAYATTSDFAADADDSVSIESITLAYESFEVKSVDQNRNAGFAGGIFKRLIRNVKI